MAHETNIEMSEQAREVLAELAKALEEVAKAVAEIVKSIAEAITEIVKGSTRWLLQRRLMRRLGKRPAAWLAWHCPWRLVPKRSLWRWACQPLLE